MTRINKKFYSTKNGVVTFNAKEEPNGKYYTKINSKYVGTINKKEIKNILEKLETSIKYISIEDYIKFLRDCYMKQDCNKETSEYKQYNKTLPVGTINQIKQLAKHYDCTENDVITLIVKEHQIKLAKISH